MNNFSSLIEILSAIELRLNSALADSKDTTMFNKNIEEVNNLLKSLNDFILEEKNNRGFDQSEKDLMKKILSSIIELEKINKNKLGFFDSLNNYFYDSINK
jgi:archaellum biogenesis ATPase FlaH